MNPKQQHIAIAKACNWHNIQQNPMLLGDHLAGTHSKDDDALFAIPNYPKDLNACHEMEKVLNYNQLWKYHLNLQDVKGLGGNNTWKKFHATASQRCEAFLKTLNLWKE